MFIEISKEKSSSITVHLLFIIFLTYYNIDLICIYLSDQGL